MQHAGCGAAMMLWCRCRIERGKLEGVCVTTWPAAGMVGLQHAELCTSAEA